jgi:hypothetical protein
VYVVCCYLHLLNLKPMVFRYPFKQLFRPISPRSIHFRYFGAHARWYFVSYTQ